MLVFLLPQFTFAFGLTSLTENLLAKIMKLAKASCSGITNPVLCSGDCQWVGNPRVKDFFADCSDKDCDQGVSGCSWQRGQAELEDWFVPFFDFGKQTENPDLTNIILDRQCVGRRVKTAAETGFCIVKLKPQAAPVLPVAQSVASSTASTLTSVPDAPYGSKPAPISAQTIDCAKSSSCSPPCARVGSLCKNPVKIENNVSAQFLNDQNITAGGSQVVKKECAGQGSVTYDIGAVVVGGQFGFSICGKKGWVPCPNCEVVDLTVVPFYYVEKYNQALEEARRKPVQEQGKVPEQRVEELNNIYLRAEEKAKKVVPDDAGNAKQVEAKRENFIIRSLESLQRTIKIRLPF